MQPGDLLIDRYEIERLGGSGGMGDVYRAKDRETGEAVAVKVLRGAGSQEPERFARESRVLSELHHPGIVRHVAHGSTDDGEPYLVMEWLEGEDLQMRLARSPLTVGETLAILTRVAGALALAHEHKIVHRDIKPSNVFLVGNDMDHVKLLDFGIARIDRDTQTETSFGMTFGTPEYMSPEQARGARDLDGRADVFSLGCVVYECLTGRPAFSGSHLMALLARVLLEEAPHVRELRPEVPAALDALVARMLSKAPEGRPSDGAALLREIEALDRMAAATLSLVPSPATLTKAEQLLLSVVLAKGAIDTTPGNVFAPTLVAGTPLPTFDAHRAAVTAHGGTLERLADGTLIATLSGTGAATDQAAQAARCALAMRLNAPESPMALATGRGDVSLRGPVGEVLERAARMLDRETEGVLAPIRVDDITAGLLDARFDLGADARGLLLRSEREVVEGTRTLLGRESPCVGREREIAMLDALWEECIDEPTAHAVVVTGAAGVGKSRLRYEFLRRVRGRGGPVEVWVARGDPMGAASPFGLLGRALRRTAGVIEGEAAEVRVQRLRARVARHVDRADVARVTEFLGELVGTSSPAEESVQLTAARQDPRLMGDQMRRAWEDFARAECTEDPLLIVLEDLHWGDLPTVSFVDAALRALHDRPFMVIALARPEVHESFPRLWAGRPVTQIQLDRLSKKASERLVREFLGDDVSADTVARVLDRAEGNPFYLEEIIRSVAEGRGEDLPATVVAMVQARLERLAPEARRVLRAGSIFGQSFWRGGLLTLLGDGESAETVDRELDDLVEKEILARRGEGKFPGEEEYIFRHTMLREGALAMLTPGDLALGHRLAGEWLERAGESDPTILAEHFERGGEPARAVAWFRRAADQALGGNDLELAVARAERGIRCGATGEVLGALCLVQAEAHRWRGEPEAADAAALAAASALPRKSALWYTAEGEAAVGASRKGDAQRARDFAHHLDGAADAKVRRAEVIASAWVAMQLLGAGDYEDATTLLDAAAKLGADMMQSDPQVAGWTHRALALRALILGDSGEFLRLTELAAARFEDAGDVRNACLQRANAGSAHCELGSYRQAEDTLRVALAASERAGLSNVTAATEHTLGLALARLGRLDEARAFEERAVSAFQARAYLRMEGASRVYLASILLRAGELGRAEAEARAAIELLSSAPPARVYAMGTLARVLMTAGRAPDALVVAREAAGLLESLGGVEEGESLVRLVHAEALDACGERDAARVAVTAAEARLMKRAERIGDASLRKSFLESVTENAATLDLARRWRA